MPVDRDRLVGTFVDLARIDSPSLGEGAVAALVSSTLAGFGWEVTNDRSGPATGNVIARRDGAGRPLLLASHLDVVPPCAGVRPQVEGGWITSDGTTVLGADAKASVAAMIELARSLAGEPAMPCPPLELIFTWGEELGHRGAKALDRAALRADRALVLDALEPVGTIVARAPSYVSLSVALHGGGGHAGVDAASARSAIVTAAEAISALRWGQVDAETTANVGTIAGGSARNAVAAEVRIEAELRGLDDAALDRRIDAVTRAFRAHAATHGLEAEIDVRREYRGYGLAESAPVVDLARRGFARLGSASVTESFGGSDANELNAMGVEACVLGIGAELCHSTRERIAVPQLVRLAEWLEGIVAAASAPP